MIVDDIKKFALNIKSDIFFDFNIKKLTKFTNFLPYQLVCSCQSMALAL